MLTLHHLNDSRSQRILWLLEELGTPYEMKRYQRDAKTRLAPPELEQVHPLGKSPVITDGEIRIAESGAIVDYIIRRYGKENDRPAMMPVPGGAEYEAYNEWLHYAEGSAMLPLMLNLYVSRLKEAGAPLHPRIDSEIANHLGYVDGALGGVDSKDSLLGANQIQGFFLGGGLGCDGSVGFERCGLGADGASDYRSA
nr:glutathione S-transferase [Bradyrhizobium canariense]